VNERLHHLDALRALTMLLILPFHALVLIGLRGGTNDSEDAVLWTIHVFRLPLFFLVAGFFAALLVRGRGTREFLRNRAIRIGIPLIIGVLAVIPFITWEIQALSELPHREYAHDLAAFVDFHPAYLWFLWYLVLIYAVALLARSLLSAAPATRDRFLRAGGQLLSHWAAPLVLAIPTALFLYRQPTWIPEAPAESFSLHLDLLAYYAIFFVAGWLLLTVPDLREQIEQRPKRYLALAAITFPSGLALYLLQSESAVGGHSYVHVLALLLFAAATWSLVLGLLGIVRRFGSRPNPRLRYWTDAAYWIYLSHFPVMAAIALAITGLAMPESLRAVLLVFATLAVIFPAYGAFVRHTAIGRVLHGPRARSVSSGAGNDPGRPPAQQRIGPVPRPGPGCHTGLT
jgi:peptidoglycan/LPS O-acetylase OafA/YrhL